MTKIPSTESESELDRMRLALADELKQRGFLSSAAVEAAFRTVPRHVFLPDLPPEQVYRDEAILIKRIGGMPASSSSQPAIMAIMLEQLGLERGHRVLEIGSGTGFNAALMAHIVGENGQVVTMEIDTEIAEKARMNLGRAGYGGVRVVCGDGHAGLPDEAPFDRIILTAAADDIAAAWWRQLHIAGRLVLPLVIDFVFQKIVAFERRDDHLQSVSVKDGGFMPLRDAEAALPQAPAILSGNGLSLLCRKSSSRTIEEIHSWVGQPSLMVETGLECERGDIAGALVLWLSLHDARFCMVSVAGDAADNTNIPNVFSSTAISRKHETCGILDSGGLCLLGPSTAQDSRQRRMRLAVYLYGTADHLVQSMIAYLTAWNKAGRPGTASMNICAYPKDSDRNAMPGELVTDKASVRLLIRWQ